MPGKQTDGLADRLVFKLLLIPQISFLPFRVMMCVTDLRHMSTLFLEELMSMKLATIGKHSEIKMILSVPAFLLRDYV